MIGQELLVAERYEIHAQIKGDLDNDGVDEKVIVYNVKDTIDTEKVITEIQILKLYQGTWNIWKKSRNAIREGLDYEFDPDAREGFEGIDIKNGLLKISHSCYPKAPNKWRYTDTYRFQNNEFELIEHHNFSLLAFEYLIHWNFNSTTGRIEYKKEFIDSHYNTYKTEKEIFYKKDIMINLNNRYLKTIKIVSPKYNEELVL